MSRALRQTRRKKEGKKERKKERREEANIEERRGREDWPVKRKRET